MVTVGLVWVNFCPALWVNYTPAVTVALRPLCHDVLGGQVKHLFQSRIRGEHRLGFGHFPKLPMQSLYDVCGIDNLPYLVRILEEG
jgi:hypothetical protein